MKKILITGIAGFIGSHIAQELAGLGHSVLGFDSMNSYYDPTLKRARIDRLRRQFPEVQFFEGELENLEFVRKLFREFKPDLVVHLAAQAGVRYSLENPLAYISSNVTGFAHIMEACREFQVEHLIYASSSSVYGGNEKVPFSVTDSVDRPVSLYAATKKSNELMAHSYSHLYGIRTTGLRFFTVYGPWGRPDMAYFKFTKSILSNTPIQIFNHGKMSRDFTFIDDVTKGILGAVEIEPRSAIPLWKVYNIGHNHPDDLMVFVHTLERLCGREARMEFLPLQPGDVVSTFADIEESQRDLGFRPVTSLEDGLRQFVDWYRTFYGV